MTEPFRWKNCFADVLSNQYGTMTQAFLRDVVEPSLAALDTQVDELKKSDDVISAFILTDTEALLKETTMAFCLSIQSLWERQIRAYLQSCANELKSDRALAKKAISGNWEDLDRIFKSLRGISLKDFEDYPELNLLHLLGNACRHGNGPSLQMLWEKHRDLWPQRPALLPPALGDATPVVPSAPTIEGMVIHRDLLRRLVRAIASFWHDTECIYLESLESKHAAAESRLTEMRQERAGRRAR